MAIAMSAARAGALEIGALLAQLSPPVGAPASATPPAPEPPAPETPTKTLGINAAALRRFCPATPQGICSLPTVEEDVEAESECSTTDDSREDDTSSPEPTPAPTPEACAVGKSAFDADDLSLPPAAVARSLDLAAATLPEAGGVRLPSLGSARHQFGDCKPCAFVAKGSCRSGTGCKFCHLCPPDVKKRRKQQLKASARSGATTVQVTTPQVATPQVAMPQATMPTIPMGAMLPPPVQQWHQWQQPAMPPLAAYVR